MKKQIYTLLLLLPCFASRSQSCFLPPASFYNTYSGNIKVSVSEDFNNDGKQDMVTTGSGQIYTNLQIPSNSFTTVTSGFSINNCIGLTSGDYNNDGNKDIIGLDLNNITGKSDYYMYLGQGNGTFTLSGMFINQGFSPTNLTSADFNNDGKLDIAYSTYTSVVVYPGLGNGNFSSPINTGVAASLLGEITSEDFNGDGKKDAILNTTTGFVVMLGQGNGAFTFLSNNNLNSYLRNLISGDVNNDGKMDLASRGTDTVFVNSGNGNGTFSAPLKYYVPYAEVIAYGDINNDLKTDLMISSAKGLPTFTLSILYNTGPSYSVAPAITFTPGYAGTHSDNIYCKDFNSDSKLDIAVATYSAGGVYTVLYSTYCIWPGDANSDGIANNLDILELGVQYGKTGAARTTTSNAWNSYTCTPWTGTTTTGQNVDNADCNGDGIINSSDTLAVFLNYGLTHNKPWEDASSTAQLYIVPDQPNVYSGTWGSASIYLGDVSNPISSIHGISFTAGFDQNLIQTDSVYIAYVPSFIYSANLDFRKRVFSAGSIYAATTHTNLVNASGYGKVAVLHYKIKPTLMADSVLNIGLTSANKMSASGQLTSLTTGNGTLTAKATPLSVKELSEASSISVYPNPSRGVVSVSINEQVPGPYTLKVLNTLGEPVYEASGFKNKNSIDMSSYSRGVYFIEVSTIGGRIFRNILLE